MKTPFQVALTAAVIAASGTMAGADTIKVGVIATFSGPFAIYGKQYREAIEVYVDEHGTTVGDHEIEFIYKDVGGTNPDNARALAQ
ncbi:MAG: ABC transporter substrate-binding protein, partial [Thermaurantiacus sp.]